MAVEMAVVHHVCCRHHDPLVRQLECSMATSRWLQALAETFDAMLCRLQTAFEDQRRFIANASHELRTPLAVMRTTADGWTECSETSSPCACNRLCQHAAPLHEADLRR
jgi:signal transduction histidine kinase